MMRLLAISLFLFICVTTLNACNTTKGVGQDIEAAGEAIEKKAKEEGAE